MVGWSALFSGLKTDAKLQSSIEEGSLLSWGGLARGFLPFARSFWSLANRWGHTWRRIILRTWWVGFLCTRSFITLCAAGRIFCLCIWAATFIFTFRWVLGLSCLSVGDFYAIFALISTWWVGFLCTRPFISLCAAGLIFCLCIWAATFIFTFRWVLGLSCLSVGDFYAIFALISTARFLEVNTE